MKKLLTLILLAALIVGGWYLASPWLAMKGIVDAAEAGDLAELDERIDFARLQDQANSSIAAEIAERTQDGGVLERIGSAIAGEIAGAAVDNALTPQGIANIVTVGGIALPFVPERFRGQDLDWDVEREGLDSFRAVSTFEDGTAGPVMQFERDGIGWDLVGLELAEF